MKTYDSIQLTKVVLNATENGYNRAPADTDAAWEFLDTVDPAAEHVFLPLLLHEHIMGEPSHPHVRGLLIVTLKDGEVVQFQFDVSMGLLYDDETDGDDLLPEEVS